MEAQTYDDRTKRVTVGVPKQLHNVILVKLQFSSYATISELIRSLLRQWANEEIIQVKPIGRVESGS